MVYSAAMRPGILLLLLVGSMEQDPGLLKEVREIAAPGSPGALAVWGENASVIVTGKPAAPVVVAARWEKGRVVAFSHDGYLARPSAGTADTARLLENSLAWVAGKASPRAGALGHAPPDYLKARSLNRGSWTWDLASLDVLVLTRSDLSDAESAAVAKFVRSGGGLLVAQTGWGWLQGAGEKAMTANPLNVLLAPAGLGWTDGFARKTGPEGFLTASVPPLAHGLRALDALLESAKGKSAHSEADLQLAADAAMAAFRLLPKDEGKMRPRIRTLLSERAASLVPKEKAPLGKGRALDRFLLACQVEEMRGLPAAEVRAHPAAAEFPGPVPSDAPPVTRTLTLDLSIPGWHSTGLYAPPGKVVTVTAPPGARLTIRVGAHVDRLWHLPRWSRLPEVTRTFAVRDGKTELATAFGGLLYVEGSGTGTVAVTIGGAVDAPLYVLGKTTPDEWRRMRALAAPWAELATKKVVITVPSAEIRALEDPGPLMEFWGRILDAAADLAGIPRERPRPERYVADVQISAGYMHSGYPIMTHLDAASAMASLEKMKKGQWGLVHELGHNHQRGDWTFEGTGEVTNNLFSLYLLEVVCGVKGAEGHDALRNPEKRIAAFLGRGAKFSEWKEDPFLALQTYIQLQNAFGWDAFKKVFAEYRDLPREKRPKGDDEKRDQWMVRFSRVAGRNLGPFFTAWGIPTSAAARESIKDLPDWMAPGIRSK